MHKHTALWSFPPLPRHTPRVPPFSTVVHTRHWAMSIALKSEGGFKGIKRHGVEYWVSLYADDLLLYVSDSLSSLPSILSTLDSFSVFSGYKLKVSKSECFPINQLATEIPTHLIPFKTAVAGIKHLGIMVTRSMRTLKERNSSVLTTAIRQDLQKFNKNGLPLSLAGRVQTVKNE